MVERQRDVSNLPGDLKNSSAPRLGLHIIVGRDGSTTEAIFGGDACRWLYSGLMPVKTAQRVLLQYHGAATIYGKDGKVSEIRSPCYGGRIVEQQQRPYA
ncbi:MAG: hypothetical protein AABX29_03210 [Nanoarchaeota archaeon]